MGIRVAIIDDNPHVAWEGRIHSVNATFQQFAGALLDLPGSPVETITSCVPVRDAEAAPQGLALDPRIRVVRTAPFDGIAGYLRHLPGMLGTNRTTIGRALADADLVWLKVPASNAALAAATASRAGVARFVWVAGSAADVAAARYGGPGALGARTIGAAYDLVGRLAGVGGHRLVIGEGIVTRDGIVASLVEPAELGDPALRSWPPTPGNARLAWAGRLAEGKGLEALLGAIGTEPDLSLDLLGDGPARARLESIVGATGAGGRVTWAGHVSDRSTYMDRLARADAFIFPSPAEGFPKVVLDALAVGLPVLATRAGALGELADAGLLEPIAQPSVEAISAAWHRLRDADPGVVAERRRQGHAFASRHSRTAEAARLVARWRAWWPDLPWEG